MAAVKSIVNEINMNHTGQIAIQFGTQNMELERTWPASFRGTFHKCVPTMAALSQKQVEVNNMKMYDTKVIFSGDMALQTKL